METRLSEAQLLIRDSLRDFLTRAVDLKRVRHLQDSQDWDAGLWDELATLGWLGLPFPESMGGDDGTITDVAIAVEEVARSAALIPYMETMLTGVTLVHHARPELASDVVSRLAAGTELVVPAVLDDLDSFATVRESGPRTGRFTGTRSFVDYGQFGRRHLVRMARDGTTTLELVDATGAEVTPLVTTGRTPSATIAFRDAESVLATGEGGYDFLLALGRLLAAVQCLGYMQRAFDMAADYVKNRVQFGRPIGSFQAVQHHIANMAILIEATRFMVYEAVWSLERGESTIDQVATAKGWASKAAVEVTALAHQLHGGIGVTEEYDLHFFSLRAKERSVAWGTPAECMAVVAGGIGRATDWTTGKFLAGV